MTEHVYPLRGALGIRDAAGLASDLRTALESSPSVLVDASGLASADLAIVQVLVAARRSAAESGGGLTVCAPPDGALAGLLAAAGFPASGDASPLPIVTDRSEA